MRRPRYDIVDMWCVGVLGVLLYRSQLVFFFFQAEDGIRDLVRSRGLGDVYKRQVEDLAPDRQDRLGARVPSALRRPAGGVTLDDEHLSLIHI